METEKSISLYVTAKFRNCEKINAFVFGGIEINTVFRRKKGQVWFWLFSARKYDKQDSVP